MNLQSSRSDRFYVEGGSARSGEIEHQAAYGQDYEPSNQIDIGNLDDELLGDSCWFDVHATGPTIQWDTTEGLTGLYGDLWGTMQVHGH